MVVNHKDAEILCSDEVMSMRRQYREKFGEDFLWFNYIDFPGTKTQAAADMYREILKKALADDKPSTMVSHWFDSMDH